MIDFLTGLDYSPLLISIKTGIVATIISFFLGIYAARYVVKKGRFKVVVDGLLTLPLVLPPTVAGFILLRIFSLRGSLGIFLYEELGIKVVQTWLGLVLAATIIAFPLMYKSALSAFLLVDENVINAAKTLGMSNREIFWRIRIPLAKPGLISGTVLAFARAMGEYGATSMLAGNIPGKTSTISQKIAMVIQDGDYKVAGFWVLVVVIISFVIILTINVAQGRRK